MKKWNYNLEEAPKSYYTEVKTGRFNKEGEPITKPGFIVERIFAVIPDSSTVTISYWLPRENRWCMFTKEHGPLCWKAWPTFSKED